MLFYCCTKFCGVSVVCSLISDVNMHIIFVVVGAKVYHKICQFYCEFHTLYQVWLLSMFRFLSYMSLLQYICK